MKIVNASNIIIKVNYNIKEWINSYKQSRCKSNREWTDTGKRITSSNPNNSNPNPVSQNQLREFGRFFSYNSTNIWYKLGGESIMTKRSGSNFDTLVMLGKSYSSYEMAERDFKRLFWFTYRKELKIYG